jgi:O-Antigen ligase
LRNSNHNTGNPSVQFWVLTSFLVLVFVTGGSSRVDVHSLAILRPASVIACAFACITLRKQQIFRWKWTLGLFSAIFFLAALHVAPVSSAIWQSLHGSAELGQVEKLTDLNSAWRSFTLAPVNGWQSLWSLSTALAIILLGVQLKRDDMYRLLVVIIALAAISGFIGLLQSIGGPQGPLYFYRVTNNGSAVGLFANRNHAATLLACLFPMLAVYASTDNAVEGRHRRPLFAAAIAIVLVPLILVTGSRSGMVAALIGLVGGAVLYRRPEKNGKAKSKSVEPALVLAGLSVVSLGFITFFFSRAEAINRLFANMPGEDNRIDFWKVSTDLFWQYFPLGSGSGSFVEIYRLAEPMGLLNASYLNHTHNDWLEIVVTFGLPAMILCAGAGGLYLVRTVQLWTAMNGLRQSVAFARMAGIVIALIGIASVSDYPLRAPIIMAIFAISVLWFGEAGTEDRRHSRAQQIIDS